MDQRNLLGSTFGTKKTVSMIRSMQRNQIDYGSIQDVSNDVHALVDNHIQNDNVNRREERAAESEAKATAAAQKAEKAAKRKTKS